ncbi:EAL domain-containing protein [Qipengyuania sp.]|uniref:EAL domain-containing protein n=1 Tax=Qipengyuania sp. TaxID=2004515 RepID=UPI0035C79702
MTLDGPITRAVTGTVGSNAARLRHVGWATLIALVLAASQFLHPIDMAIWTLQSRTAQKAVSGDIVFLEVDPSVTDADLPSKRRELTNVLESLRQNGAEKTYIDLIFDGQPTSPADWELVRAAAQLGRNLAFVNRIDVALGGSHKEVRTSSWLTGQNDIVLAPNSSKWPNTIFDMPTAFKTATGTTSTLAADLAGTPTTAQFVPIDYAFLRSTVPAVQTDDFLALDPEDQRLMVEGKRVIISALRGATTDDLSVPTQHAAPPSYVSIYAAETIKRGGLFLAPALPITALVALTLGLVGLLPSARGRLAGYGIVTGSLLAAMFASSALELRVEASYPILLIAVFVIVRSRARWAARAAELDPDTGLPTLRALSRQLRSKSGLRGHVVVAKLHSYENILKTLNTAQRATYIQKLCERLRIGDSKLTVYVDGQHLAWLIKEDEEAKLVDHLEGLRAIFAAPVPVDQNSIDVGITFGAARIKPGSPERCLAAALAASEETTEAFDPVKVASDAASDDSLWDLSLRARIDAAMEAGEVFCVYQPKMNLGTRTPIGVEALVRWDDPERGSIPPLHFVMQCEKAGRIEYLTRYVLQSACSAANLLHFRGHRITMSVNISATLLSDMRIVGIVRNVLQATGLDPNFLMLEITETSRIRDLQVARKVMKALKSLGTSLSMDDFGVGAANFEALQALPFDEIKIDRQFVSRALTSPKSRAITASIVSLGADARISVVAEGAETEADLQMLREIGCRHVQGYAFARPMPLTNLLTFMEKAESGTSSAII